MIFGFNTDIKQGDTVFHVQSEARQSEQVFQTQVFVRGRCIGKHESSYALASKKPEFTDQQMQELLRNQHRLVLDSIRDGKIYALLGIPTPGVGSANVNRKVQPAGNKNNPAGAATVAGAELPQGAVPLKPPGVPQPRPVGTKTAVSAAASQKQTDKRPVDPALEACALPSASPDQAVDSTRTLDVDWVNAEEASKGTTLRVQFRVSDAGGPAPNARIFCRVDVTGFTAVYAQANTDNSGNIELKLPIDAEIAHDATMLVQATQDGRMATKKFRIP